MTTFNTGNPLGSTDVYDRYDNSENLDNFSNGPLDAYADRFGVSRQSLQGIRNASQYVGLGPYAAGLNFTAQNQVFSYLGEFYAPSAAVALPYTTTGSGAGEIATFRSVGDAVIRSDLASDLVGARIVARSVVVFDSVSSLILGSRTANKVYKAYGFHAGSKLGGGEFFWDSTKPKSDHDGALVIDPDRAFPAPWSETNYSAVDAWFLPSASGTGCFVRVNSKEVTSASFGGLATDTIVDHPSFVRAVKSTASKALTLRLLAGTHLISETEIVSGTDIVGDSGSVIKRYGNYCLMLGVFYPNPVGVSIKGVSFDNNAPGTVGTHKYCMRIGNAKNVYLDSLSFYNGYDSAIQANGPDGIYINSNAPDEINNIHITNCTFDGFTRNGMSVTDGVNGLTISRCTFKNNGLTGLDIEANIGSSVRVRNVLVEDCLFLNNGDFANSGATAFPKGHLGLFSASPTSFHSEDVTIRRNRFETTTALNSGGVFSITTASAKRLKILDNVFIVSDAYLAANGYGANLNIEVSTYKSEDVVFSGNSVSNHIFQSYSVKYQKILNNNFYGAWTKVVLGSNSSNQIDFSGNTLLSCAAYGDSLISVAGRGVGVTGNRFVEDRSGNAPAVIVSTDLTRGALYGLSVNYNTSEVINDSRWGKFFSSENVSGTKGVGTQIVGNTINGCNLGGIIFRDNLSFPAASDIIISGNKINGVIGGYAIDTYKLGTQIVSSNVISQGASGQPMVRFELAGYASVTGNALSFAGGSPASHGLFFDTPQVANSSVVSNNITSGTTSGNYIAAGVLAANNVVI